MATILSLLAFVLLGVGVYVLVSGVLTRRRGRPARFGWPVGVGLLVVATVLVNLAAPQTAATAERASPPAEEAVQEEGAGDATESQDLAEASSEAPAVPEASGERISVGLFLVKCRSAVKAQLKSPATAKFPGSLESAAEASETEAGERTWSGHVDSENGFGAVVRTDFVCRYDPADGSGEVSVTVQE